jgi:PAS domain S-box-containing protein
LKEAIHAGLLPALGTLCAVLAALSLGLLLRLRRTRRAAEELEELVGRLREASRVAKVGLFDHDLVDGRVFWSAHLRSMLGYSADERIVAGALLEHVFPADRPAVARAFEDALDPGGDGTFDMEHRMVGRDGAVRWLLTRARTYFSASGFPARPVRTTGILLDVTDRRNAEDELRERERVHSALISQSGDGIALIDTATLAFVEFNDAACATLGYERSAFARLEFTDLLTTAAIVERVRTQVAVLARGQGQLSLTELRRADGAVLPVFLTGRPVTHHERTYLAVAWSDGTERERVDRSNRKLASLVRHSHELIAIANLEGRVEFVNDAGRGLVGLRSTDSVVGCELGDLIHPSEHERLESEVVPAVIRLGHWSGELAFQHAPDGEPVPTLTTGFRIDDAHGQPINIATTARDITALKQADAELHRINRIHRTLSQVNQSLMRGGTEEELLTRICQIAVEEGGYALAFIGLVGRDGVLQTSSAAGPARGYVENLVLSADESRPEGRGPAGQVLRSGLPVVINDFTTADSMSAWRDRARQYGICSGGCFPLRHGNRVIGLFNVYSTVVGHFGAREQSLLATMAADISFGLESSHRAVALDRSRRLIRDIEATVSVGALRLVLADWSIWWSEGTPAVLNLPAGTPADRARLEGAFDPEIALILVAALEEAGQTRNPIDIDLPLRGSAVGGRWIRLFGVPKRRRDGHSEVSCTLQDISERKRLEAEVMDAADRERRRLASELHDNLGQILFGTSLLLGSIARDAEAAGSPLLAKVNQTTAVVTDAVRACRELAHGASPIVEGGLAAALRDLAARTAAAGVACTADTPEPGTVTIGAARSVELYRIAQEAVTNALKHARCAQIELRLRLRPMAIEMTVHDDGVGLAVGTATGGSVEGIGLRTMRYRAARAGGLLELRSTPQRGTTVRVVVPLLGEAGELPLADPSTGR